MVWSCFFIFLFYPFFLFFLFCLFYHLFLFCLFLFLPLVTLELFLSIWTKYLTIQQIQYSDKLNITQVAIAWDSLPSTFPLTTPWFLQYRQPFFNGCQLAYSPHLCPDNGPKFIDTLLRQWLTRLGVRTLLIEPGSPWENGNIEQVNGKLRDELLDPKIFFTLEE